MNHNYILIGIAIFNLLGCASNSGVVPIGPDTYMVSRQAATGFTGLGTLKADAFKEASAYCVKNDKHIRVTNTSDNPGPYIMGNFPRAEIQFMCLERGDSELTRPKMQKLPDTLVLIEKEEKSNVNINRQPMAQPNSSYYEKLKELKKMKDDGLLSSSEYELLKQKTLRKMSPE
jgi:hypothetical protein